MRISYLDESSTVAFFVGIIQDETDEVSIEPETKYLTVSEDWSVKESQLRDIVSKLGEDEMLKISSYSDGDTYTCYVKLFAPPQVKVTVEYEFDSESGDLIAFPLEQSLEQYSRKIYTIVQC